MPRGPAASVLGLLALSLAGGCAGLRHSAGSPLSPLQAAGDSVLLEVLFVRLPPGSQEVHAPLWNDIDEQQFPVEARQRLEANGFRVGLAAARLPPLLEGLLNLGDAPPPKADEHRVELGTESTIRGWKRQVREGEPREIVVSGQQAPLSRLAVLLRNDDGEVSGEVFHKAQAIFVEKAFPQNDGRVRVELVPEIVYGDPQNRFVPGDSGNFEFRVQSPRKVFDRLRIDVTLSPGQILILGGRPEREGSLGSHYFTEQGSDGPRQQLLLIRLAQANRDDLFAEHTMGAEID
jgi:hypothetical protein